MPQFPLFFDTVIRKLFRISLCPATRGPLERNGDVAFPHPAFTGAKGEVSSAFGVNPLGEQSPWLPDAISSSQMFSSRVEELRISRSFAEKSVMWVQPVPAPRLSTAAG